MLIFWSFLILYVNDVNSKFFGRLKLSVFGETIVITAQNKSEPVSKLNGNVKSRLKGY